VHHYCFLSSFAERAWCRPLVRPIPDDVPFEVARCSAAP